MQRQLHRANLRVLSDDDASRSGATEKSLGRDVSSAICTRSVEIEAVAIKGGEFRHSARDKSPHGVRTTALRGKSGERPVRFVQRRPAWGASSFVRSGTGPQSGSAIGCEKPDGEKLNHERPGRACRSFSVRDGAERRIVLVDG